MIRVVRECCASPCALNFDETFAAGSTAEVLSSPRSPPRRARAPGHPRAAFRCEDGAGRPLAPDAKPLLRVEGPRAGIETASGGVR